MFYSKDQETFIMNRAIEMNKVLKMPRKRMNTTQMMNGGQNNKRNKEILSTTCT